MATLKTQEISKQLELSYMTGFSAHDEATASQLRRQIAIMDRKLRSLEEEEEGAAVARDALLGEAGTPPKRARPEIFPPALSVPKLRFDLERLIREQKIRQTLYTMLVQRLETAKVNEARDTSTFQILDRTRLRDRKPRPKGAQVLGLGLVLGLLAAVTW